MAVKIVKEDLDGFSWSTCLVQKDGEDYFVVSSVRTPISGFETLVFPADKDGNVLSWLEVAGGRGDSRAEAIADLESRSLEEIRGEADR